MKNVYVSTVCCFNSSCEECIIRTILGNGRSYIAVPHKGHSGSGCERVSSLELEFDFFPFTSEYVLLLRLNGDIMFTYF